MSRVDAERLLTDLKHGLLITQQTFEGLDVDDYLDERDDSGFAEAWMQAFHKFKHVRGEAEEEVLRSCREKAYKQTMAHTSEPELAGYVSDDFGLIAAYLLQDKVQDSFVEQLFESYKQGNLPSS
ncbi:hypothetical protein [Paenibacillus macerans]|uniref:Uncharacterized protein n=1 Tax=Paenibacillus macerans TaxID=44252 RepID=A0A090Y4I3_PAEMA|nr:hypothetical protein [Paenibacillus macerans]KFM93071.1 hypothetical protein DJ90_2909 [Paenibacillus macerans]MCY7558527.1 hypothetical protein [Paenibacillus macerans]MEC0153965.1 hypothetical protein [Paenibacillus macerans]SUA84762.1 Uncharacterised protein [Paenibacillus macerans]